MRLTTFIALTGANEDAITTVGLHLAHLITRHGAAVCLLQGVRNALEADLVTRNRGEIWRIGEDADTPELDPLIDRTIDDTSPVTLVDGTEDAFESFLQKAKTDSATAEPGEPFDVWHARTRAAIASRKEEAAA